MPVALAALSLSALLSAAARPQQVLEPLPPVALEVLAHLGAGNTPAVGPSSRQVREGLAHLVAGQDEDGRLGKGSLLEHAVRTLALTEAACQTEDSGLETAAGRALGWLEAAALPGGGWSEGQDGREVDARTSCWAALALTSGACRDLVTNAALVPAAAWRLRPSGASDPVHARIVRLLAGEVTAPGSPLEARLLSELATFDGDEERHLLRGLLAYQAGGDVWNAWTELTRASGLAKPDETGSVEPLRGLTMQLLFRYANLVGTR